jgi:aerobic-type carbon monoxide dehydrogenase small subunit (CoxS/CutS family)
MSMESERSITLVVNGKSHTRNVPVRRLLSEFLREDLGLTGTHVGCEHGVCGSCTIEFDGATARACLMLAVQADGATITTVEGLAADPDLHPIQKAFWEEHGLQCGFCTPGMLLSVKDFLAEHRNPSEEDIRHAISGNLCRCTGYQSIVRSVMKADQLWER